MYAENSITSMKFGWCNFNFITVGNEEPLHINASYLTDVPDVNRERKVNRYGTFWKEI